MSHRLSTKTIREDGWYVRLFQSLCRCLNEGFSNESISVYLNQSAITSPTGLLWNATKVAEAIKKLRHPHLYRSKLHAKLISLLAQGKLNVREVSILYRPGDRR